MSAWDDLERNAEHTVSVFRDADLLPDTVVVENDAVLSWDGTNVWVVVYDNRLAPNVSAVAGSERLWAVSVGTLAEQADVLTAAVRAAVDAARAAAGCAR